MKFNNFIARNIILPIGDIITGQSIYKSLIFLSKSQYWSRKQIDDYQNDKLRKLVQHAYLNVPFYRDIFNNLKLKPEQIQTKEDLIKLPIITKEELKKNQDKLLATNLNRKDLVFSSSSGSTGEPFQFYTTRSSASFLRATAIRSWYWMGYRLGDKYVKVSMNPRSSMLKQLQDRLNNSLYLSATQLTQTEFQRIVNEIHKCNPQFIRCYPVPIQYLSKLIRTNTISYQGDSLVAINTTGSTLNDEVRKEVEDVFNVKIFDSYSCEGGTIFAECPEHGFYHPAEEYAITEFIEDSFTKSEKDNPVRHITTDLHNYASPFIRYDTQDYLVLGENKLCTCGRQFLNVKRIKGRDSDILITPSGKYLIVENFVAYFEWIQEVDQIQVVQEKRNEIVIKLLVNNSFNTDVKLKISNYWRDYIGGDVNVIIEVVDKIKLTPTGKRRTLIRNPEIKLNA